MAKKSPNPIDAHVGARLRLRRILIGMSQERLASALGLTFQQVQKYEKGMNRIGAGRLYEIARALDTSVQYFFEDVEENALPENVNDEAARAIHRFIASPEGAELVIAFSRIKNQATRRRIADLVRSLSEGA